VRWDWCGSLSCFAAAVLPLGAPFCLPGRSSVSGVTQITAFSSFAAPEAKKRGVIAASAGNHALALAYHGQELGIPVVRPPQTPNHAFVSDHDLSDTACTFMALPRYFYGAVDPCL